MKASAQTVTPWHANGRQQMDEQRRKWGRDTTGERKGKSIAKATRMQGRSGASEGV